MGTRAKSLVLVALADARRPLSLAWFQKGKKLGMLGRQ